MTDAEIKESIDGVRGKGYTPGQLRLLTDVCEAYLSVKGVEKKQVGGQRIDVEQENKAYNNGVDATRLWIAKRLPTAPQIKKEIESYGFKSFRSFEQEFNTEELATVISELIRERLTT